MSFEEQIQQWVLLDNQLKVITDKMKEIKDKKNKLSEQITEYVDTNNLSNKTIQLSDGKLKFGKVKDTQTLTFRYLETCLNEIIKNEEQVSKIIDYVKNKRETKYISEIKRYYSN
jgi:ferritin